MKNLTIAFLAATSLFTLGACKKKGGDMADAMAKASEFKDKMCACKDKDCATKVNDDYTKWGTEMASKMASNKDTAKPDDATMKKMTEVAMGYSDCMSKAMGAGGGAAPAADGSGSAAAPAAGSGSAPAADGSAAAAGGPAIPECDAFKAVADKAGSCDKLPEATRKAFKDSYDQTMTSINNIPAEQRASAGGASCKGAADAIEQNLKAAGC
ncbi:MAG TPA: hypothetical protein VGM39_17605 [Kofleriaceae bacterium]